jgi:hypothetical protein
VTTALKLDDFTLAYIECALWASNDDSTPQGGDPLDSNYGIDDIDPDTLARMVDDCRRFQEENAADLALYNHPRWTAPELGGHDFWLTRNGHGCGFWDRHDCLPEDAGERLTAAAEKAREYYIYLGDDGVIYGSPG